MVLTQALKGLVKVLAMDPNGFPSSLHDHGSQASVASFQKKTSTHIQDLSPNTRRRLWTDAIYGFDSIIWIQIQLHPLLAE